MIILNLWKDTDGNILFLSDDPRYHPFGQPYKVNPIDVYMMDIIDKHLADHPDALQPEPLPPLPPDAQLEASAEAQRQALFGEYDLAVKMLSRAERLGDATATTKLAAWDEYAVALQSINNTEGWFRDPQWPVKPEM